MNRSAEILRSARREALFTAGMWVTCFTWTVGYCAAFGYGKGAAPTLLGGIPDWVVWGILAPWSFATVVSCVFALRVMKDEELGEEAGEGLHE
jgi:hypothetical protein